MYEKTMYFSKKFIWNGLGCLALSAVFIPVELAFSAIITFVLFLLAAFIWLFLGFRFKKKLKLKTIESEEMFANKTFFKWTESGLRLLLVISVFLYLKHLPFMSILCVIIGLSYLLWLVNQTIKIEKYLKA